MSDSQTSSDEITVLLWAQVLVPQAERLEEKRARPDCLYERWALTTQSPVVSLSDLTKLDCIPSIHNPEPCPQRCAYLTLLTIEREAWSQTEFSVRMWWKPSTYPLGSQR